MQIKLTLGTRWRDYSFLTIPCIKTLCVFSTCYRCRFRIRICTSSSRALRICWSTSRRDTSASKVSTTEHNTYSTEYNTDSYRNALKTNMLPLSTTALISSILTYDNYGLGSASFCSPKKQKRLLFCPRSLQTELYFVVVFLVKSLTSPYYIAIRYFINITKSLLICYRPQK